MHLLYSTALLLYLLAAVPTVIYKRLRRGKAIGSIAHRLGRLPESINVDHVRSVWIHAVSVGEVLSARSLLNALRQRYPAHRLLLSTTTATGQEVARQLGDALDGVFYAPLDLPLLVERSLDRVSPDLVVFVDTELAASMPAPRGQNDGRQRSDLRPLVSSLSAGAAVHAELPPGPGLGVRAD